MAHYDDDTKQFMQDVSRNAAGIARDVSRRVPLSEAVAKRAVGIAAKKTMEKDAGVSGERALNVYNELNAKFGNDWQDWEPETLEEAGIFDINPDRRNLVMALQVICKTNFPFEDWSVFENVNHAINNAAVHFDEIQGSEIDHIAHTIHTLKTIRPEEEFSLEVCGYIAACAKDSGIVMLPEDMFPLQAVEMLSGMNFIKNIADLDEHAASTQRARLKEIAEYVKESA